MPLAKDTTNHSLPSCSTRFPLRRHANGSIDVELTLQDHTDHPRWE